MVTAECGPFRLVLAHGRRGQHLARGGRSGSGRAGRPCLLQAAVDGLPDDDHRPQPLETSEGPPGGGPSTLVDQALALRASR